MAHRLRYAMSDGPLELMVSTIEADETYVGGRRKRVRGESKKDAQQAKFDNKVPVVALANRDTGKVRATVMPRVTRENLHEYIDSNVNNRVCSPMKLRTTNIPAVVSSRMKR